MDTGPPPGSPNVLDLVACLSGDCPWSGSLLEWEYGKVVRQVQQCPACRWVRVRLWDEYDQKWYVRSGTARMGIEEALDWYKDLGIEEEIRRRLLERFTGPAESLPTPCDDPPQTRHTAERDWPRLRLLETLEPA